MPERRAAIVRVDVTAMLMVAAGVLLALAILGLVRRAEWVLTPLLLGVLFGMALDPVVAVLRARLKCSRAVATLVIAIVLTIVFGGVVLLLGPRAVEQAGSFAEELPATVKEFYSWPLIGDRLEQWDAIGKVEDFVEELPGKFDTDTISAWADRILGGLGATLLVLVTTVAVLLDGDALVRRGRRLVPPSRRERADDVGRIVYRSIARYFAGSITVALLNGTVILTSGLILGIPLAPLAGIWSAITNLIPQIGGFLGGAFFVLLAFSASPLKGVIALVIFLSYQQLENHVIQPTIIGRAVNLKPPTTMLAALIGGAAAGVPGALVATPLIGAAKSVWLDVFDTAEPAPADEAEPAEHPKKPGLVTRIMSRFKRSEPAKSSAAA
ncbi:MAG: AI-2E family transporter [Ilumatobacteraceae bacterium]